MDLVSACIFCAGFLLGGEPAPRPGLSTEIGLSYATLSRQIPDSAPVRTTATCRTRRRSFS